MNDALQDFARAQLKEALADLPESNRRTFALMCGRDNGKRSVEDATAMRVEDIVDLMDADKLDWAMQQVQRSLDKLD